MLHYLKYFNNLSMLHRSFEAKAVSRNGSGYTKMKRINAAPAPQHWFKNFSSKKNNHIIIKQFF
jgi:hypothetical protein